MIIINLSLSLKNYRFNDLEATERATSKNQNPKIQYAIDAIQSVQIRGCFTMQSSIKYIRLEIRVKDYLS